MKASRYIVLSFLVTLVSFSLAAQVNDTYVVPAAGNTPGANGTIWATQVSLFNPQTYPLCISVTFIPTLGAQGVEKLVTVPANAVAFYNNVLNDVYGLTGTGALLVATFPEDNPTVADDVVSRAFLVESDTYNNAKSGTFGQTIPGIWTGLQDFTTDGISAIAHGILNQVGGWRANVGAVNLGRSNVTLRISVYDYNGNTILSKVPFGIPPLAHFQQALPVAVDRGSVEFFLDDPSGAAVVFPYVSVVDPGSGDPTYHSPTLLATPAALFKINGAKRVALLSSPGRKIDITDARAVREAAVRLGEAPFRER